MPIGHVVKRSSRYFETFVVPEVLAYEAAGWDVEIFSVRMRSTQVGAERPA